MVAETEKKVIGGLWDELFDQQGMPNEKAVIFCRKNGRETKELRRYIDEDGLEFACLRWIEPVEAETEQEQVEKPPRKPSKRPPTPTSPVPSPIAQVEDQMPVRVVLLDLKAGADKRRLEIMRQCPDLTGAQIEEILSRMKK